MGLGFCLLLICLILCMHAYCVITVADEEEFVSHRPIVSPISNFIPMPHVLLPTESGASADSIAGKWRKSAGTRKSSIHENRSSAEP